jgi:outer membrane lipoprotein-sorting protein
MKKLATLIIFCGLLALSAAPFAGQQPTQAPADTAKAAPPTVDQIIDNYVMTVGGKAAMEKVTSRVSKGTAEVVGLAEKGSIEIYEKAPDKICTILKVPGVGARAWGSNGTLAWAFNPDSRKIEERTGKDLAAAKAEADFYKTLHLRDLYSKLSVKGVEKIQYREGPRATYVIEAANLSGEAEKLYFDTTSGLLIRHDTWEGKLPIREFFLDHTEVDGVKIPFTRRQAEGRNILILRFTEVKQNVPIDEARFNKPRI